MECETFQRQALEVRMPDETYDPSVEPQDGEEYLTKVVYERNNCPAIVVAEPPKEQMQAITENNKDSCEPMFGVNDIVDTSPPCLHSLPEWQIFQLKNFDLLRKQIIRFRYKLANSGYTLEDNEIPYTNERDVWKTFCQNNQPLLSIILRIDQRSLEKLLKHQIAWLQNECNIDETIDLIKNEMWLGSWIYSTLACLHLPLEPNVHSLLRCIAKTCILIRNKLTPDDIEKVIPFNLFILIIAKTFNQLDLLEYV